MEIAHKEVIQTPRYFVDSWSTPLSAFHCEFSSTDCLLEMFARGKPTNKKIVTFHANLKTWAQGESLSCLKHFFRRNGRWEIKKVLKVLYRLLYGVRWKDHIGFNNLEGAHTPEQCWISLPHIHPFRCSGRNGTAHCPQSIGSLTLFELSLKSAYENCLIAMHLGILGSPKSGWVLHNWL